MEPSECVDFLLCCSVFCHHWFTRTCATLLRHIRETPQPSLSRVDIFSLWEKIPPIGHSSIPPHPAFYPAFFVLMRLTLMNDECSKWQFWKILNFVLLLHVVGLDNSQIYTNLYQYSSSTKRNISWGAQNYTSFSVCAHGQTSPGIGAPSLCPHFLRT